MYAVQYHDYLGRMDAHKYIFNFVHLCLVLFYLCFPDSMSSDNITNYVYMCPPALQLKREINSTTPIKNRGRPVDILYPLFYLYSTYIYVSFVFLTQAVLHHRFLLLAFPWEPFIMCVGNRFRSVVPGGAAHM